MAKNKQTNSNGAFRKKRVYFTQVSNHALRDKSISLKAKGLFALIQSYITIPDFILYKTTLKKDCSEGDKAFESAWKELKDAGYLKQFRLQDEKTKQFYYEYELLDIPEMAETSQSDNESHTPKKEGMDNGVCGKGGIYINTDLTHTDLNNTNLNNKKRNKEKTVKKTNFDIMIDEYTTNPELIDTIKAFIQHRFANNKKITDASLKLLLKELDKLSTIDSEKIEILNKSIICGYSGIFPLNKPANDNKNDLFNQVYNNANDESAITLDKIKGNPKTTFTNYSQRNYDYKSLEKQLLGW